MRIGKGREDDEDSQSVTRVEVPYGSMEDLYTVAIRRQVERRKKTLTEGHRRTYGNGTDEAVSGDLLEGETVRVRIEATEFPQ